jgi:hypothetical protein
MKKMFYVTILFFFIVFQLSSQSKNEVNISGIWNRESKSPKLTDKSIFSWGEQAYNPLGTLNIDLDAERPFINGSGIVYKVKEVLRTGENEITIIILDWFVNKEVKIYIEVLDNNKIIVKNDIFYPPGNLSTLYTRVPIDAEVGSTILNNRKKQCILTARRQLTNTTAAGGY